jgi:perosamine synthetase
MKKILQYEPQFDSIEAQYVNNYMTSGGWITEFKQTQDFEKIIAAFVGVKHAIAVTSGTTALTLAALASGIKKGDKVIVPNYTMIATPNSLKLFGAEPVFVDVEPETLCLDYHSLQNALTSDVKAVILVLPNGRYPSSGIDNIINFAKINSLLLIEDAAQGLGSYYQDQRHVGTVGLAGTLSFSPPKIISTGQGGMILTNDKQVADKAKALKDFGRSEGGIDIHDSIGFNFKFTDIQAAVGIAQMTKLEDRIKRKKHIYNMYQNLLHNCTGISLFNHDLKYTTPWFIDCIAKKRNDLQKHLDSKSIGTRRMYSPINSQKAYNILGSFPVSENIGKNGLWLPSHPQLENNEIEYICREIISFYS